MKPTRTPNQPLDAIADGAFETSALARLEGAGIAVAAPPLVERWAGGGFILGGLVIGAAVTVQLLVDRGYHFPNLVFRSFHLLGPIAFIGAAAGGFVLGRSRLARWLTIVTLGFMAAQAGWTRFLPSIGWTTPRLLLGVVLVLGGIRLITKPGTSSDAAV